MHVTEYFKNKLTSVLKADMQDSLDLDITSL